MLFAKLDQLCYIHIVGYANIRIRQRAEIFKMLSTGKCIHIDLMKIHQTHPAFPISLAAVILSRALFPCLYTHSAIVFTCAGGQHIKKAPPGAGKSLLLLKEDLCGFNLCLKQASMTYHTLLPPTVGLWVERNQLIKTQLIRTRRIVLISFTQITFIT